MLSLLRLQIGEARLPWEVSTIISFLIYKEFCRGLCMYAYTRATKSRKLNRVVNQLVSFMAGMEILPLCEIRYDFLV